MAASEELGIIGVDSYHFFVNNPARSRSFYERFGFRPVARSGDAMTEETGQASVVYSAGGTGRAATQVVVSTPQRTTCRAARYLKRHPAGIGSISFQVADLDKAWRFLTARDATPIHSIRETRRGDARYRHFSITTALGDVAYRFVEREGWEGFAPGFDALEATNAPPAPFKALGIDHITSNAPTMAPMKLWLEHVLGMEQCWSIEFHTEDVKSGAASGTGLKSVVMWDPRSGLKFPINEPLQPFFKDGQINKFVEENSGAGVQHIAIEVDDIVSAVRSLRTRGVGFLETSGAYYDQAPGRLAKKDVDVAALQHRLEHLRELGILIDGKPHNRYLIQIFLKDAATLYAEPDAGPFFYELIQRCGDDGFGEGTFRALFESIERIQEDV